MSDLDLPSSLLDRLRMAQSITVLTGGGLARECGVIGFREAQQREPFWQGFEPQELATMEAYMRNPKLVWEWFAYRRALIEEIQPGAAHYALVDLEQLVPSFKLITQAIDGLHWMAGSRELIELHGSLRRTIAFDDGAVVPESNWDTRETPPRCGRTGSLLRPDVVFYGEGVSREKIRDADAATKCDLFLCIGTEAVVEPAGSLPLHAKRWGATVIEINPKPSTYSIFADHVLHGDLGELVSQFVALFEEPRSNQ